MLITSCNPHKAETIIEQNKKANMKTPAPAEDPSRQSAIRCTTLTWGAPLLPKRGYLDEAEEEDETEVGGCAAGAGGDAIGDGGAALLFAATIWLSNDAAFRTTLCTTPMFSAFPLREGLGSLHSRAPESVELWSVPWTAVDKSGRCCGVGVVLTGLMNADCVCVCRGDTPTA